MIAKYGKYTPQVLKALARTEWMSDYEIDSMDTFRAGYFEQEQKFNDLLREMLPEEERFSIRDLSWDSVRYLDFNSRRRRMGGIPSGVQIVLKNVVKALILKDRIPVEMFDAITFPWRKVFGEFDYTYEMEPLLKVSDEEALIVIGYLEKRFPRPAHRQEEDNGEEEWQICNHVDWGNCDICMRYVLAMETVAELKDSLSSK